MNPADEFFAGAPEKWILPLVPKGLQASVIWQQKEYVECRKIGISFAAHRDGEVGIVWHYQLPTPKGWAYISVYNPGPGQQVVEYDKKNPFYTEIVKPNPERKSSGRSKKASGNG